MKTSLLVIFVIGILGVSVNVYASEQVTWDKELYASEGMGIVTVIDKSMNLNIQSIDSFHIHVWSDIDHNGINLSVTETEENSGVFKGTTWFSAVHETKGARLLVEDTVNAEHKGNRDSSKIIYEPEPPTMSDEQKKMLQQYCETGVRHPHMEGIPQCIEKEPSCDPYDYECGMSDPSLVNQQYGVEWGYALVIVPPLILGILLVFIILRNRK